MKYVFIHKASSEVRCQIRDWLKEQKICRRMDWLIWRPADRNKDLYRPYVAFDDDQEDMMVMFKLTWSEYVKKVSDTLEP